jgi:hypothetical protein
MEYMRKKALPEKLGSALIVLLGIQFSQLRDY